MTFRDSSDNQIFVGCVVRFRGKMYEIARFKPGEGRYGSAAIEFTTEQHTPEVADEISVDKMKPTPEQLKRNRLIRDTWFSKGD